MSGFDVIHVSNKSAWDEFLAPLSREPHLMCSLYETDAATLKADAFLLTAERDGQRAAMPVLIRDGGAHHVHNFGGPYASASDVGRALVCGAHRWCELQGLLLRATLNPMMADHQSELLAQFGQSVRDVGESVIVDLTVPLKMRGTTRRLVEGAIKAKITIKDVTTVDEAWAGFDVLYAMTMDRRSAAPHWRRPVGYFMELRRRVGDAVRLIATGVGETVEAAAVLLHGGGRCYYHYAGNLGRFPEIPGIGHALVATSINQAAVEYGCSLMHLGGGLKPGDGLHTFKAGFSQLRAPRRVLEFTKIEEMT